MNDKLTFTIVSGRKPSDYRKAFYTVRFGQDEREFGHCTWRQLVRLVEAWAQRNNYSGRVDVIAYA